MGGTQIRGGGLSPRLCKTSWCDPSFLVSCAGVVRSIEIYPARARTAVLPRRPSSTPPAPWTCCSGGHSHRWQGHFHAPCVRRMEKHERNIQRGTCGNDYTARGQAGSRGVHRRAHPGGPHGARRRAARPPRRARGAPNFAVAAAHLLGRAFGQDFAAVPLSTGSLRGAFRHPRSLKRRRGRTPGQPSAAALHAGLLRRAPRRGRRSLSLHPCTLRLFRPFTMCTTLF